MIRRAPPPPDYSVITESERLSYLKKLRDEFACKAMQGLVSNRDVINRDAVAKVAYEIADSMLKAREL